MTKKYATLCLALMAFASARAEVIVSSPDGRISVDFEMKDGKPTYSVLYDGQVAMSTVHLTLREVITYTEVVEPDPTFGQRISRAFKESWSDFGAGCQNFAVWFVEAFPTLLVLGVIGGGIATVVIVLNRKAEKRRRAARANSQPVNPVPPYRTDDKK